MEITVLQWNIWYKEDISNIAKFLKENKADIICLQELTVNSPDQSIKDTPAYLAKELGYEYYCKELPIESTDGVNLMLANGIFSRFPVVNKKSVWTNEPKGSRGYDDEYRAYVEASINTGIGMLNIGTTHMSYTHRFEGTPNKDEETTKLVDELKNHESLFIFTGDLNAVPGSNTISSIESNLVNAGPADSQKSWTTKPFSYNGFEATDLNWRLDYVFTTKDIEVISSEIIDTKYSDHLPVLVRIKLPVSASMV